jgi:methylphosphotriester-DNA--protein-cysteine methyltransferase
VFHRYLRTGISAYANALRLDYVEQKLALKGKEKLIEIIYEAGFNCPQTYYRAKQRNKKQRNEYID